MTTPALYLTPSELVFLNGEKFASPAKVFNKARLLHIDLQVDGHQLAQSVLAAAFLILEQHQTLRLEFRQKKVLLGLGSTQTLFADPVGPSAAWPAATIESQLPSLAQRLATDTGRHEVYAIIYAWFGQDWFSPYDEVLDRVKRGLVARGLLEARTERKLKIFTNTIYTCPEGTRQMAALQSLQPLQQWMGWYQHNRPEHWKALYEQIDKAIKAREEKTDTSND